MKIKRLLRQHSRNLMKKLDAENIRFVLCLLLLIIILFDQINSNSSNSFSISNFLDTTILISFLIVFLCDCLSKLLVRLIEKVSEDVNKLTVDYKKLVNRYSLDMNQMIKTRNCDPENKYIPVVCLKRAETRQSLFFSISHQHAKKQYDLPKQVKEFSSELMNAHKTSIIYNNKNIRIDDFYDCQYGTELLYSMTTFYDSLVTNRALDYKLSNDKTIRDIYEPGPYISELKHSKLSNHLGFHGFIELSDGSIIFVERDKKLSIGKRTLGVGVEASLKTKYCLNDDHELTKERIGNAIRMEIYDELKIELDEEENENLVQNIFAFYRDLVEGGKPQFLFYYKHNNNRKNFLQNFGAHIEKSDRDEAIVDGKKFFFFSIEKLRKAKISSESMIIDKKKYMMMPSATASVIMLIDWLE
jgi:hypothetical protein